MAVTVPKNMQGDIAITESLASGLPMIRVEMKSAKTSGISDTARLAALKNISAERLVLAILEFLQNAALSETLCAIAGGRLPAQRA